MRLAGLGHAAALGHHRQGRAQDLAAVAVRHDLTFGVTGATPRLTRVLGLSPVRLLIIVVVALIVLGPDKLPQVAKQAGSLWHSLRSLQQRVEDEIREVAPDLPRSSDLVRYARSPVSLLNQLADKAKAEADTASADDAEAESASPSRSRWTTSHLRCRTPSGPRSPGATPPSTDGGLRRPRRRAAPEPRTR